MNQFQKFIKKKNRGKLSKDILLLQDNEPVYEAKVVQAAILDRSFVKTDHAHSGEALTFSFKFLS
jgi:hypothetical protein